MKKREPISKKLRFEIFERDNFTCQYCGRRPDQDDVVLNVDHIVSVNDGGGNEKENLITSCQDCNFGKGKKSILKITESEEDVEEKLKIVKERLEQIKAMNKKRNKVREIEEKIECEKVKWIINIIGDEYEANLYRRIDSIVKSGEYDSEKVREALLITKEKNFNDVKSWSSYFYGVLRNLHLTQEERDILMLYNKEIFVYSRMYPMTRKCILDNAKLGIEFHNDVVSEIKMLWEQNRGETYKTREKVLEYISSENFTVYKSGHNLQVLVCDTIFAILELSIDEVAKNYQEKIKGQ